MQSYVNDFQKGKNIRFFYLWHWTIISGLECCEFTSVPFWQLEAVVNVERKNTEKLKYECDISLMDKGKSEGTFFVSFILLSK